MAMGDNAMADRRQPIAATDDLSTDPSAALAARLRRQLSASEEMATIGRMTAGIAQELNIPLTALLGSLSVMTDLAAREAGPKSHDEAAQIRAALRDCAGIVDRIKDLVGAIRGVSHRDHREAVFFDPARAIRNATKIFAVVHRRVCRVDLTMGPLPALHGSPNGLGQLILNLLRNGLEASPSHPDGQAHLEVAANATDTEVQIAVSDSGEGIPAEMAGRIFEEFFTSRDEKGRGLGLYLSRQIVASMRGTIAFESVPGRTVFTVRLPFGD
jgi:two-component system NtrC family sensor kinase